MMIMVMIMTTTKIINAIIPQYVDTSTITLLLVSRKKAVFIKNRIIEIV